MQAAKALQKIIERLKAIYPIAEARNIAFLLLEHLFKLTKSQVLANYAIKTSEFDVDESIETALIRLLNHEPIQYIVGTSHFFGFDFCVDPSVLIPRPETEELVNLIINAHPNKELSILDIGTGSGCIAISLAKKLPLSKVTALDVSEAAIAIATKNAQLLNASVELLIKSILDDTLELSKFDVIVSNPPYITLEEKQLMHENVVGYEPALALFVPDTNPLLFYQKIAKFSQRHLNEQGCLYVEINESYGGMVKELFENHGFCKVEVVKDIYQKDRIVSAVKPCS